MHLPQIAALPKAAEDPTDTGHTAHPAAQGEGFLAVFSGHAPAGVPLPGRSRSLDGPEAEPVAIAGIAGAIVSRDPAGYEAAGYEAAGYERVAGSPTPKIWAIATRGSSAAGQARSAPVPETVEERAPDRSEADKAPVRAGRVLPADDTGFTDGRSAAVRAGEVSRESVSGAARPDGRFLPGVGASMPAPAPNGAPPTRVPKGPAPAVKAAGPIPDRVAAGVSAPVGADDGHIAVAQGSPVSSRRLNAEVPGPDTPTQKNLNGVPALAHGAAEDGGNARRGGDLATWPQPMTAGSDRTWPVRPAGLAGEGSAALPEGQLRTQRPSGGPAGGMESDVPARSVATQTNRAGAATAADDDPTSNAATTPAAKADQSPAGPQQAAPGVHGSRPEARAATETGAPLRQDAPQPESPKAPRSPGAASVAAPAGPGVESGGAATAAANGAPAAGAGVFALDAAVPDTVFGDARGTAQGPATSPPPIVHSPETPRLVALQIAEVVRASGERAVELRLQPEELGRVQLTMSQDATGTLTVSLNVERAETLELLRRNIDLLGADLRALGYESVDFSFQDDGKGGRPDGRPEPGDGPGAGDVGAGSAAARGNPPNPDARGAQGAGSGMDIRI